MKRKEVEDVMGGKDAWANVDKTDGMFTGYLNSVVVGSDHVACIAQCPRDGCEGPQAFFYQVQIRSADEPMTTFYKVRSLWSGKPT